MKKFFTLLIILVFVIAPTSAWFLVHATHKVVKPNPIITTNKAELFDAIQQDAKDKTQGGAVGNEVTGVVSFKQYHNWWFLVTVTEKDDETGGTDTNTMLLSKFTNKPGSIRVITEPGYTLPLVNISSGGGVPYDVIEILSKGAEL